MKALLLILLILFSSCGFKAINLTNLEKFNIIEVNSSGDSRINYVINNFLPKTKNDNQNKNISLTIKTEKIKNIKERNIKNEITKYEIKLSTNINIKIIEDDKNLGFSKTIVGSYDVNNQNLITRNNEKKLIELLSENLGKEIIKEIILKLNDI